MRGAATLLATFFLLAAPGVGWSQVRPVVGVAFGGGSARGLAHIGVIAWLEEHHIPIDVVAGTSMGGLVGGAYATGMSGDELRAMILGTDWDAMFGSTSFPFKNIRRKEDARSYPSRLEFGVKRGVVPPTSLNDGQQVDLLLARIAAPYYALDRFDRLPTPFAAVAVDLTTAEKVVLDRGPLATALRATMSLPGIFPPVLRDGHVLVDGGALDNVPADVVRAAGASVVVAIDVGAPPDEDVEYSMFGLLGRTIDAMMRASTARALTFADVTIRVDTTGFGSLDWRRADAIIARGYEAAERNKDVLLKYKLPDDEWQAWVTARNGRRLSTVPVPAFLTLAGVEPSDTAVARRMLERHLNRPLDLATFERDLSALTGLDRYQSVTWRMTEENGRTGLLVSAQPKTYAPPFLMLGLNIENTTSEVFRVQLAARYLTFDTLGPRSEVRIDAGVGADPALGLSIYKGLGDTRLFARTRAVMARHTFNFIKDDATIAEYRETRAAVAGDLGMNTSTDSELSGGFTIGHIRDTVRAGDPGLPELSGAESDVHWQFTYDGTDSAVVPSKGVRFVGGLTHVLSTPELPDMTRTNRGLTQAHLTTSWFTSRRKRNRLFAVASGGTSFGGEPLPTRQFTVGYPFVLDAFAVGERRGDHYAVLTLGALRQITRLPDFLGGPVFVGGWLENGSIFTSHENADFNTQVAVGLILDTLVGPVVIATSTGLDGGWRTLFGIGRIVR